MSVEEIQKAVAVLSVEELRQVEESIHEAYRKKGSGILYDDAYGTLTEEDLVAAADEAFLVYDREESDAARKKPTT